MGGDCIVEICFPRFLFAKPREEGGGGGGRSMLWKDDCILQTYGLYFFFYTVQISSKFRSCVVLRL